MMNVFLILVTVSFFIWVVRNICFWVALWQRKEYRLDMMRVHFRETVQGRRIFYSFGNLAKWVLLFLYGVVIFAENLTSLYEILVGCFFLIQAGVVIKELTTRYFKRPVFTGKALLLLGLSFLGIICLFILPLTNFFVWILFIDRLIPLVVALFVFFLAFPTEIHRDLLIKQATEKMKEYKNVLVIAVSGSYGKTSTKEYISQMLARKFSVVKTPASNNTPIAIAHTVLKKIKEDTEVFVAELGAVKRGEVAQLADIVKPRISVTTAVSDQHISLYGNLENVVISEYELLQALPKDGLALFNGNSNNIDMLIEKTKRKKIVYECFDKKPKRKVMIGATDVKPTVSGVSFTVILDGKEMHCTASLFGSHVVENILPAVYLAKHLGMTDAEIKQAIATLVPPPQTMTKIVLHNNIVGIDDTFNASPESVFSAMDYLSLYKTKKIFVMSPLIELGKGAKERHVQIGLKAAKTCDYLFLLNKNFAKEVREGAQDSRCTIVIASAEHIARHIAEIAQKGDVVIFEGKEAKVVMRKLV